MSKHNWIVGLVSTLGLFGLLLFTVPQGASSASSQQAAVTLRGTASQTPTFTPTPMQIIVEARSGYLRAAPGMQAARIGVVRQNTRLTVLGVAYYGTQIWYLVQLEDNEQAWISDAIVQIVGDSKLVPTVDLTDFFSATETPTWTPSGPTATATMTRIPRTATRTPVSTLEATSRPTSVVVPTQSNGGSQPKPPTPTFRPPATQVPQPTKLPPTNVPPPSATHVPSQPTKPPPTNVPPPPATDVPPPQPTNPPAPTDVPPPPPTNPAPPTSPAGN